MAKIIYAKGKYVRRSPRKMRLVVDLIRGKNANQAMDILKFTNKGAADQVSKVLKSAMANAIHNEGFDKEVLIVADAYVNEAPTFKRGKAVSRGRYHQILKRNSHIVIGVATPESLKEEVTKKEVASPKKVEKKAEKEAKKQTKTEKVEPKKTTKASTKPKSSVKKTTSKAKSSSKSNK